MVELQREALASTFGAAERSRLTADWRGPSTSADSAIIPDLPTMNARARQAVRDDWAGASTVDAYKRHVVGTGITCRSSARDPETGDDFADFNRAADRLWERWCRARWCDIERKKTFRAFQGLMQSEKVTVGQGLVIITEVAARRAPVPTTTLQAFEPEMLDLSRTRNADNGNEIRGGVEINQFGAPIAYWVFTDFHPFDGSSVFVGSGRFRSERIDADRVCHLQNIGRPRQTLSHTRLAPVLRKLWHLGMYDYYQIVAARAQACSGTFIKTSGVDDPTALFGVKAPTGDSGRDSQGNRKIEMAPGMVQFLGPGEEPVYIDPKAPGQFYDAFSRRQLHQIAAGAGLDYPTVSRDFSGNTYSGQRQGMIECNYETDPEQQDLIDAFCIPVRDTVITMAILQGLLEAPRFLESIELMEAYLQADWRGQAKPWIDPQNQAGAAEIALRNRLTSRRNVLNEQGEDWRETFQQISDEERELERLGILQNQDTPAEQVNAADPQLERLKAEADAYGVAVRAGAITPQTDDENLFRSRLGLPPMSTDARRAWTDDQGVRRPITLMPTGGQRAAPAQAAPASSEDKAKEDTDGEEDDAN